MNKRMFPLLLSAALISGAALTGCASSDTSSPKAADSGSSAKPGGTLIIAEQSDATKLDPQLGADIPSANVYFGKIYEGLVKQDENMEIKPDLATEWKKVNDNTMEFKLRQGVKFHDGTPFNAAAVKKNFERVLDPKTASPRKALFAMITDIKVVDDYTVQFVTKYPFAPLLANLAHYSGGIISPKAIDDYGNNLGQHPSGTGPFKFESWTPGQEITLVKSNDYWGEKPKVDKVVFKVVPEDSTRIAMVQTGEAQLAEPVPVNSVDQVKNSPDMTLVPTVQVGVDFISFNMKKKPFDDVRVREAISSAIDTDAILNGVYNNVGTKAVGPMGPKVWGYDPNLQPVKYDVNKAKQLLADAGYPHGFDTTIWTNDDKSRTKVAEVVQSQLKGIGINVKIKVLEWGAYLDATAKGDQDMYILGWSNMTGDADYNQYFLFDTAAFGTVGNRTFYSNPEVDKLIDAGRQEIDPEKRKAIYFKAQEIEAKDFPMIYTRNIETLIAASKHVKGFWESPSGIMQLDNVTIQ